MELLAVQFNYYFTSEKMKKRCFPNDGDNFHNLEVVRAILGSVIKIK